METETTASKDNNPWPGFKVFFVGLVKVLIGYSYMAMAFYVAPFYIGTLPSPQRILVTLIWALPQPFFHACWLFFIPPQVPPISPTILALMISICSWVWSVAVIREAFGLNGRYHRDTPLFLMRLTNIRPCYCCCGCHSICCCA